MAQTKGDENDIPVDTILVSDSLVGRLSSSTTADGCFAAS
jgi:hypothetical protein